MKLRFSRQIFDKYSNIKFHEIYTVGAELFREDERTDGQKDRQMDRHDEADRSYRVLLMFYSVN